MKKLICFSLFSCFAALSMAAEPLIEDDGRAQFEEGIVSFVNSVRPAAENASSYQAFKLSLIGEANLNSITETGDNLLSETFRLLKENADDNTLKADLTDEFSHAMRYVLENSNQEDEIENMGHQASIQLFGGNEAAMDGFSSLSGYSLTEGPCKWYQIGCHLSNLWDWITDHKEDIKTVLQIAYYLAAIAYYLH